jgi:hypothetical protein
VVKHAISIFVTTTVSIFEHGLFSNQISNHVIVIAMVLGRFVVYITRLQDVVQAANPFSLDILGGAAVVFTVFWSITET